MRLHYFQHVPFEDLANIETWAKEKGHRVSATKLYLNEVLPRTDSLDWLIVMGGPMNIYEEDEYPWLIPEKKFISETIKSQKFVLGICLGAQLVADVLGGKVRRNKFKEIGWLPVRKINDGTGIFKSLPGEFNAFHWHGDTFDIPSGATRLAESDGCTDQAFEYGRNVLGLQFHLESSATSIGKLIENCRNDITEGKYVQSKLEILSKLDRVAPMTGYMISMLNEIEKQIKRAHSSQIKKSQTKD